MWNGVVTNVGIALLAQWAQGGTLTIDGARAGTGTVDVDELAGSTDVAGNSHNISIVEYEPAPDGIKYTIELRAASSGYLAMQIGVYGSLDGGETTLIAIFQSGSVGEGIAVPSTAELPDFAFTFGALVEMANRGTLNVTIDPSVLVTREQMKRAFDEESVGFFIDENGYLCQRITGDEE